MGHTRVKESASCELGAQSPICGRSLGQTTVTLGKGNVSEMPHLLESDFWGRRGLSGKSILSVRGMYHKPQESHSVCLSAFCGVCDRSGPAIMCKGILTLLTNRFWGPNELKTSMLDRCFVSNMCQRT